MVIARAARGRHGFGVEKQIFGFAVEKNVVVLAAEMAAGTAARLIGPDDLVHKIARAKHLVQKQAQVRAPVPIAMQKNGPFFRQQFARAYERRAHQAQIFLQGQVVLIGQQALRSARALPIGRALFHAQTKRVPSAKRGIDIDQLHLAREFFQQCGQNSRQFRQVKPPARAFARAFLPLRIKLHHRYLPLARAYMLLPAGANCPQAGR